MKMCLSLVLAILIGLSICPAMAEDEAARVFELLWSEDMERIQTLWEHLDPAAQKQIPPAALASLKGQLTQAYGSWTGNGQTITQTQNGMTIYLMPVHLERLSLQLQLVYQNDVIMGLAFTPLAAAVTPESARKPSAIEEIEIIIGEGTAYPLPGTLTLPKEGTNLPLAVLVHGSGPNDRNETVGATQLFHDLALALAEKGIASIRYDKRTLIHAASFTPEEMQNFSVYQESIEDAVLAARLAQTIERIDDQRVFVVGHSLGAMIAPRIYDEGRGLFKGMVLLNGSPRTLLEIMIDQNQAMVDTLEGDMKAQQQAMLNALTSEAEKNLALPKEELPGKAIFGQPAYYFWEMARFDTAHLIRESGVPILIINGGSDFQVVNANGYEAWQKELANCDHVELIYEPALNHLLMTYTGDPALKGTVREYDTPAHLDPHAAEIIAGWLLRQE